MVDGAAAGAGRAEGGAAGPGHGSDREEPGSGRGDGQLARATGLTAASITGVVDRLEQVGCVHRERDLSDRRRVEVRLATEAALRDVAPVFTPVIAAWQALADDYTGVELELIARFQRRAETAMREQLTLMRNLPSARR